MFIENPAVKKLRICKRPDGRGEYHQTLVVETDFDTPPEESGGNPRFADLIRDLRGLQTLAGDGFVGFRNIELTGPTWKTLVITPAYH
jgi:hypothetical protein